MSLAGPAVPFLVLPNTYIALTPKRRASTREAIDSAAFIRQRQYSPRRGAGGCAGAGEGPGSAGSSSQPRASPASAFIATRSTRPPATRPTSTTRITRSRAACSGSRRGRRFSESVISRSLKVLPGSSG